MEISPFKHHHGGLEKAPDWVHVVPVPDMYRGKHRLSTPAIDGATTSAMNGAIGCSSTAQHANNEDPPEEERVADLYVDEVRAVCERVRARSGRQKCIRAFIAESMQSCGGQVIYPRTFLAKVPILFSPV